MLERLYTGTALGQAVEMTSAQYSDFDFPSFLQKHVVLGTFSDQIATD